MKQKQINIITTALCFVAVLLIATNGFLGYTLFQKSKNKSVQINNSSSNISYTTIKSENKITVEDSTDPCRFFKAKIFSDTTISEEDRLDLFIIKTRKEMVKILNEEEIKVFDRNIELSLKNDSDSPEALEVKSKLSLLETKYPEIKNKIPSIPDSINPLEVITNLQSQTRTYDDNTYLLSSSIAPYLSYNYVMGVIASAGGDSSYKDDLGQYTFNKLFANRDIFYFDIADLKNLTLNQYSQTAFCKVKYDITNPPSDPKLVKYVDKYIQTLGKDDSVKLIQETIDKLETTDPKKVIDFEYNILLKLGAVANDTEKLTFLKDQTLSTFYELKSISEINVEEVYNQNDLPKKRKQIINEYTTCLDSKGIIYKNSDTTGQRQSSIEIDQKKLTPTQENIIKSCGNPRESFENMYRSEAERITKVNKIKYSM